jgi:hypothetical protein
MANTIQKNLSLKPETYALLKTLTTSVDMFESMFVDNLITIFGMAYAIERKRAMDFEKKNIQENILENTNLFNYSTTDSSSTKALPPSSSRAGQVAGKRTSALQEIENKPLISLPSTRRGNGHHTSRQTQKTR